MHAEDAGTSAGISIYVGAAHQHGLGKPLHLALRLAYRGLRLRSPAHLPMAECQRDAANDGALQVARRGGPDDARARASMACALH